MARRDQIHARRRRGSHYAAAVLRPGALFVWFYNMSAGSVPLVAIFHASSDDVVLASNTARFLIFSAVIGLAATTVIIAARGGLGRAK